MSKWHGVVGAFVAEAVFMTLVAVVASLRGGDHWKVVKVPGSFLVGPEERPGRMDS